MIPIVTQGQHENEMGMELTKRIQLYTPSIFEKTDKDKFNHLSSSILFKWEEGHYLTLTGHTLTKLSEGRFFTVLNDTYIGISGYGKRNTTNKIDMQIIKLDDYCINSLTEIGYKFYDLKKIAIDHDDLEGYQYLIVGYPNSRVKSYSKKLNDLRSEIFSLRTKIIDNKALFDQLKLIDRINLMLRYERKKVFKLAEKRFQTGPDPQGLSGCGIWRVASFLSMNNDPESITIIPTGMIIEYDAKNDALIGTRLPVIGDGIRSGFDIEMPLSKKLYPLKLIPLKKKPQ